MQTKSGIKKIFGILLLSMVLDMSGCGYKRHYFPAEELAGYRNPIVFVEDSESKETYFIYPNEPEKRYPLDFIEIFDYNEENQTFLFSTEQNGEEYIAEYDLKKMEYAYLLGENTIAEKIDTTNDKSIINAHYYSEQGKISFTYEDYLIVYDTQQKVCTHHLKMDDTTSYGIYGWKDWETVLCYRWIGEDMGDDIFDAFEVNIETGEEKRIKSNVGRDIVLSKDKTMASGCGEENWFGAIFSPVLVWDIQEDKVMRFHEGVLWGARTQLSEDHQYVMFAQGKDNDSEKASLLCMRIEDEKVCVVYETEDYIRDVLW